MATENGLGQEDADWKWLDNDIGSARHNLSQKHLVECRGKDWDDCKATPECHSTVVAQAPESNQTWEKACRNRYLLVTEQQGDNESFYNYSA